MIDSGALNLRLRNFCRGCPHRDTLADLCRRVRHCPHHTLMIQTLLDHANRSAGHNGKHQSIRWNFTMQIFQYAVQCLRFNRQNYNLGVFYRFLIIVIWWNAI